MYSERGSDNDIQMDNGVHTKRRILFCSVYLICFFSVFFLGLFVIGPMLSRGHSVTTTTVAPSSSVDIGTAPTTPPSVPSTRSRTSKVTITETTPDISADVKSDDTSSSSSMPNSVSDEQHNITDQALVQDTSVPSSDSTATDNTDAGKVDNEDISRDTTSSDSLNHVRVGLFADKVNADSLASKLTAAGFSPAICPVQKGGRQLYSVQAGAFKNRKSAEDLASSLRKAGFESVITSDN